MKKLFIFITLASLSFHTLAQNTIGGVKTTIPEAEMKRQSAFLTAERDRLLGRWDKALEEYKGFVYDNPEADAAWYGLSRTYSATNDPINAMDAISKAIAIAPDNQWYMLFQADLFEKNGRNKDALATYETLVKRYPQTPEFYEKLAYLAVLNEDPKKALKALDKYEQIRGVKEANIAKKHLIYVGMGDNKKAAEEYRKLVNAFPGNIQYRYQLADFYERIGDKVNAKKTWEEIALQFPGDPMARLALTGQQNQSGAEAQYLESMRPLFADPKIAIDVKVKELVPFLAKLEKGADPSLASIMLELGGLLEKAHPDEPKAWSISGDMLYLTNKNTEALEKYRQCIKLNPAVFSVWDNTLNILRDQKNFPEMLSVAEKAMDAFPNQAAAYLHYGFAANNLKKYDDALNQLQQALIMSGANANLKAEILDQMGESYLGKGDKAKAVEQWKKALDINKSPAIQDKINRAQ